MAPALFRANDLGNCALLAAYVVIATVDCLDSTEAAAIAAKLQLYALGLDVIDHENLTIAVRHYVDGIRQLELDEHDHARLIQPYVKASLS